jgi:hypothetical protein
VLLLPPAGAYAPARASIFALDEPAFTFGAAAVPQYEPRHFQHLEEEEEGEEEEEEAASPPSPAPRPLVVPKHVDPAPRCEPPPANLTRAERVARYLEKKSRRKFEKTIRWGEARLRLVRVLVLAGLRWLLALLLLLLLGRLCWLLATAGAAGGATSARPALLPPRRPANLLRPAPRPPPPARYASRKAYAEVRPRIKGRFAKKEEVDAWRAAERAIKGRRAAASRGAARRQQQQEEDDEMWAPPGAEAWGVVPSF